MCARNFVYVYLGSVTEQVTFYNRFLRGYGSGAAVCEFLAVHNLFKVSRIGFFVQDFLYEHFRRLMEDLHFFFFVGYMFDECIISETFFLGCFLSSSNCYYYYIFSWIVFFLRLS